MKACLPKHLPAWPAPSVVFIGGGGSDPGVLDAAIGHSPSGGRLVANAVTLEMEALLLARHTELAGNLTGIAISRAGAVGTMQVCPGPACHAMELDRNHDGRRHRLPQGRRSRAGPRGCGSGARLPRALPHALSALATAHFKRAEDATAATGKALKLPLLLVDDAALRRPARADPFGTLLLAVTGAPSVSGTAAAAGQDAKLLGPRVAVGPVTCAIAIAGNPP